mgnify:CR=1 FL=1
MTNRIKIITTIAIFSGIICVISPITLPVGMIPITLSTFAIYLIGGLTKKYIGIMDEEIEDIFNSLNLGLDFV